MPVAVENLPTEHKGGTVGSWHGQQTTVVREPMAAPAAVAPSFYGKNFGQTFLPEDTPFSSQRPPQLEPPVVAPEDDPRFRDGGSWRDERSHSSSRCILRDLAATGAPVTAKIAEPLDSAAGSVDRV